MIRISVVVCTYNRAGMLARAVDSLIQQTLDEASYEIVVLDNASMDNTRAVVQELKHNYPAHNISLVADATVGLGYARNTGFEYTQGEYVAFMDDDAYANTDWL